MRIDECAMNLEWLASNSNTMPILVEIEMIVSCSASDSDACTVFVGDTKLPRNHNLNKTDRFQLRSTAWVETWKRLSSVYSSRQCISTWMYEKHFIQNVRDKILQFHANPKRVNFVHQKHSAFINQRQYNTIQICHDICTVMTWFSTISVLSVV